MAHLYVGAPSPAEYVEMLLCREFGVLPSVLRAEPGENVTDILAMMQAEKKVRKQRGRSAKARRGKGG